MKTILVLTDLSYKAENAALYALKLAEKINANIILYNSIKINQLAYAAGPVKADEHDYEDEKNESTTKLAGLAGRLSKHHQAGSFKPTIEIRNKIGNLADDVDQLLIDKKIDLIIMGAKSDGPLSYLVVGETNTILNKIKCPVLFVSYTSKFERFKTIVFSTDLKKAYPQAVNFLVELARVDNADIVITHVGKDEKFNHKQCLDLFQSVFEYPSVAFKQLPEGNIGEQLESFASKVNADLTVMIHHERLLYGQTAPDNTSKMLNNFRFPLLVLPDQKQTH
jgi:nucleotide-binding universal stress UspA family protein